MTRTQMIWLALLIAGCFAMGLAAYSFLPERSPIHWNIRGEVDGYGSRIEVAFFVPVIIAVTTAFLVFLSVIKPLRTSLERSGDMYGRMVIAVMVMLAAVHALILLQALGKPVNVPVALTTMMGVLFMVLGNWMGKIRRNKLMGIRTPWTLASDVVWERTHRIGGRLFVLVGLATALTALLTASQLAPLLIFFVGIIGVTAWAFVYSRRIYQTLPDKPEPI